MSTKEELTTVESQGESLNFSERLNSLSVRWKIRIAYWAGIILTACLVIIMVNIFQRRAAIHHGYDKVFLLRNDKTKIVEAWFERLSDKITNFASDQKTLDAQSQLTESFLNIENDNYSTPGAETPDKIKSLLEGYYTNEIIPVLESRMDSKVPLNSILPADNKELILQYLYVASNGKPLGSKLNINKGPDASSYSVQHAQFQPGMAKFARESGISDIFLVDYHSGNVIYSLQKNPDFATNLYDGPYENTGLGLAFKAAIGLPAGSFQITDESLYAGDLLKPALFISAPLYAGSELKGAAVFSVDITSLDQLLAMDKDDVAGIPGLKSFIVGPDLLYRNNDPSLTLEPGRYVRRLKRLAADGRAYLQVEKLKTTAMIQQVNSLAFADGIAGKERMKEYLTETGEQVLSSYGPVAIPGLNWMLVSQLDKSQALKPVRNLIGYLIIISFILALLAYIIVHILSDRLADRLSLLGTFLHNGIYAGKNVTLLKTGRDEIEMAVFAAQQLKERIFEASKYTDLLGNGNLEVQLSFDGEEDKLSNSLNNLKNILVNRREEEIARIKEDEIRNWSTHGVALFNDILRMDNENLEKLCLNIIRNIIQYLSANQGGIFLVDKEEESSYLNLVASYAFDRQKFLKKRIAVGEGLAGTCALEKKTVLLGKIPEDYIEITSGLGGARPSCLLIVPLKKDEEVLGVMEIASFNPFRPHEVEFVEKVAESIASALITVRLHLQTSQYLERFQQQAEEMKAQDEELRQNIEELQATHEQMERMKAEEDARNQKMIKEMEDNRKLLLQVLDQIPGKIFLKDHNGVLLLLNSAVAKVYGKTVDELIGTSDFDNHPVEDAKVYREKELEIMSRGAETYIQEESLTGETKYLKTTKMPFFIPIINKTGLLGIQMDVTDVKEKEVEATKMAEEIKNKQDEIERYSAEMQKEKALLDALLNNVPEHIYFKDKDSKFLRFSKSMLKLFGLERAEDLVGKSDFDFFDSAHAMPAFEGEQKIIKTGKAIIDLEEKEVMEDGRVNYVNTTKMPLRNVQGEIIGTFGISKDITHLKKLEQDAVEKNEELKAQEEELRQNIEEMHATQDEMRRQIEENHKMQDALSSEKALLDALLNNVPEHIYFKDKESKFIRFSKSMIKLFGLERAEDLVGKSDFDFFDKAHAMPAFEGEQKIIKTGKAIIDLEEKEVMEDGRVNWVNTTKMPLRNVQGEIIGTFGISKDITHLKRLEQDAIEKNEELKAQEEELRQNLEEMHATQDDMRRQIDENHKMQDALSSEKSLLDALLNNVPEHIYFKDKESKFLRFSKSMLKLFGLEKPEDLVGKSDFDFFDNEHAMPAFEGEQKIIKTGKAIIDLEEKEVMDDGRVNWVNTTKMPLRDAQGKIIGTFGISKDISHLKRLEQDAMEKNEELKAQEEELRQNLEEMHATQDDMRRQIDENHKMQDALSSEKSLLDALLNNVPEHIYFKDKESKFLRFSKSMLKLFGLEKPEDLVGKSDFDFFDNEHAMPAFEGEQKIIKTGKAIIDLEEKEVMEDGRVNWVNTTKMPLRDARGQIIGTFGISKDITRLKKLEAEANKKMRK